MRYSFWPSTTQPWESIVDAVAQVEREGWDGMWVADHFMPNEGQGEPDEPMLEAWSVLAGLAVSVPRLRLGTLVCGNTYRHPTVLANQAASTDVIAGGRVVLGVGAGWQINEHAQYGIELGSVGWRMNRFEEACEILRSLLHDDRTTFSGEHYQVTDAVMEPSRGGAEPLPIMIGGGGEKRTLRITARFADEWNVWGTPEILRHKNSVLDAHCDDVGRDPSTIARTAVALLFMSDDESWLTAVRDRNIPRPTIIGTPAEVVDIVGEYADAGVDELIIPDFTLGDSARRSETLSMFTEQVMGA